MNPRHRASRSAIELLKRFEGFRPRAQRLSGQGGGGDRWIIGHGHTQTAREGVQVSEADAEALLLWDLMGVARGIEDAVFAPLTQAQFDALCSFVFAIGLDRFRGSDVLRWLNEGQPLQAACAMELWRKAKVDGRLIVVDALVRRRAAEKALFLSVPAGEAAPAPSAILRAVVDMDAGVLIPAEPPAPVETEDRGEGLVLVGPEAEPALGPRIQLEPEAEPQPLRAAAEQVTARFQSLYPEAEEVAAAPVSDVRPQADFAPPITTRLPEPPADEIADLQEPEPEAQEIDDLGPDALTPDELDPSELADIADPAPLDPMVREDADIAFEPLPEEPYPFRRPTPPRRRNPPPGLISLIVLASLGLAFVAGGLVWGLNATPSAFGGAVSPQIVGLLAGSAGVLMFCVAAYMLLEKLGRAAEGDDGDRD